jgi:preprotein translocase subunit YajC
VEILIPILLLIALTYFVLVRPQRRRQQQQNTMLSELSVGDEILTAGGLFATIRSIGDDQLTVEIAPGTNVKLDKRAVALIVSDEERAALSARADEES